jgi:hypothetical protein
MTSVAADDHTELGFQEFMNSAILISIYAKVGRLLKE